MSCEEYQDRVAADVDGRLGEEAPRVEAHVAGCPACQALREEQAALRDLLRQKKLLDPAPIGLRTRILARLEDETAPAAFAPGRLVRWASVAIAALAVLALFGPQGGSSLDPMIEAYYAALRGTTPLELRTSSLERLEVFYSRSPEHADHVVDLRPAGFRLLGGMVREVEGRSVRLSVYSDGKNLIVCDYRRVASYLGDLPQGDQPLFFSRGGLTFCIRRMGDEICILATRLPMYVVLPRLLGWA